MRRLIGIFAAALLTLMPLAASRAAGMPCTTLACWVEQGFGAPLTTIIPDGAGGFLFISNANAAAAGFQNGYYVNTIPKGSTGTMVVHPNIGATRPTLFNLPPTAKNLFFSVDYRSGWSFPVIGQQPLFVLRDPMGNEPFSVTVLAPGTLGSVSPVLAINIQNPNTHQIASFAVLNMIKNDYVAHTLMINAQPDKFGLYWAVQVAQDNSNYNVIPTNVTFNTQDTAAIAFPVPLTSTMFGPVIYSVGQVVTPQINNGVIVDYQGLAHGTSYPYQFTYQGAMNRLVFYPSSDPISAQYTNLNYLILNSTMQRPATPAQASVGLPGTMPLITNNGANLLFPGSVQPPVMLQGGNSVNIIGNYNGLVTGGGSATTSNTTVVTNNGFGSSGNQIGQSTGGVPLYDPNTTTFYANQGNIPGVGDTSFGTPVNDNSGVTITSIDITDSSGNPLP